MPPCVGLSQRCDTAPVTGRRYAVLTATGLGDTPLPVSMVQNHRKDKSGIVDHPFVHAVHEWAAKGPDQIGLDLEVRPLDTSS